MSLFDKKPPPINGMKVIKKSENHMSIKDAPFSDGVLSPIRSNKTNQNHFVSCNGADSSIYNVFQRSKHKLFEGAGPALKPLSPQRRNRNASTILANANK